ncbi:MAG: hypothetical protein HYT37_02390 [Candidatus Sungbacteria bacterium]|nr:hypothetical protein [Candidatus Sungbacteria bacterium]
MKKLIEAGLFGAGLTPIDTPELARRYNICLKFLGIEPTALTTFSVDGIGWSPEIALERKNNYYLCAGIANPMGVIMTPNQRNKPVYFPFSSYERPMLRAYFDRHHNAIADITATAFVGLDIDQELTRYESPYDLTLVRYVILRSIAGGLFDAAKEQKALVGRFMSDTLDWFNTPVIPALIKSAEKWGDLRHRSTDIPDFRFDIHSYYTLAFGGVFVLRSERTGGTILIVEDEKMETLKKDIERMALSDKELPSRLRREGFAEINLGWYRQHQEVLTEKKENLLAWMLCKNDPVADFVNMKMAQKRQHAMKLADDLPPVYHQIERFSRELAAGRNPKIDSLPSELQVLLLRPHAKLPESEQEVVWMLLSHIQQIDVFRLYAADKNSFFTQCQNWPENFLDWAATIIRERYIPRMSR